ncbi:MAG: 5-formyltetrahydrofolate cyclo-ligase [Akkermansia sp.]
MELKKKLRQDVLNILQSTYVGAVREEQSLLLRGQFARLIEKQTSLKIAIYAALPHEVNLLPLLEELPQHQYYIPRCAAKGVMEFHRLSHPSSELEQSKMGFFEPKRDCAIISPEQLDWIIVPGVAFTKEGARLGYGGGFYDRYLPRCPQTKQVALCFAKQIVASIPSEAHDLSIPLVVSSPR